MTNNGYPGSATPVLFMMLAVQEQVIPGRYKCDDIHILTAVTGVLVGVGVGVLVGHGVGVIVGVGVIYVTEG